MIHRLLNYLTFNLLACVRSVWAGPADVVFCTNGSFFSGITGRFSSLIKRTRFVYNLQDLYPEVPIRAGQLTNPTAIAVLRTIERYMYRTANEIAVITPSFQDALVSKGVDPSKIEVIPNFVDVDFIQPLPKDNDFAREHGVVDRFVVAHSGNIGFVYDLQTLVLAADELREREEILFLIIGDGVEKQSLVAQVRSLGLQNVLFLPFQPRETLPWIRASSDVQVALYRKGSSAESMPSKVYEIMASGRPVLATADAGSDMKQLIDSTGCGICGEPENVGFIVDAINHLIKNEAVRHEMAERGRKEAVRLYSREVVVDRYERLLGRVAAKP
jgi:colanic acid biosynthesis glycosyl transferase WcaI